MKLDPTKEYQYRNGEKPWKIIFDVPNKNYTILSISQLGDSFYHFNDGKTDTFISSDYDLIEVKKKIKGWVNVYGGNPFQTSNGYETKKEADDEMTSGRIGCFYIEFTEGEGL